MNSQMAQKEIENKIIIIYTLLEETFKGKDSQKIKEALVKLNEIFTDINSSINLLFLALSTTKISGKEISLDLHKSVSLFLKNLFTVNHMLDVETIFFCCNQIFDLIFNKSKENPHLVDKTIFISFQEMLKSLLSSPKLLENKTGIIQLFNTILTNLKNASKENYLQTAKSVILLSSSLLSSERADSDNYEKLIDDYYIPIINNIFFNVPNYLNPKNNIYNIEFIIVIRFLLDGLYPNLLKMKGFYRTEKIKEICLKFFREYGTYCFELVQLMPEFDEETKNKYGNPNPIIVFNKDEKICYELNLMKSKAIQFISLVIQISTLKEEKMNEYEINYITDKELQKMISDLITLIINSFQDILNSKEKFNFIKRYTGDLDDKEDSYNSLLFQICVFLTRGLVREPIKSNFSGNIRQFLLNILFPLIVTIEDENIFLETDSDGYHQYINDIIFKFKNKNFRTSACFLVKKICETFEEMSNFVLSFCLEMLNYIIKEGKNIKDMSEYNVYLKYKTNAMIDQFNDKIKLDFSLLIILILKDKINQNTYLKNRFLNILLDNYNNIHLIPFAIIKIKICKIYYYFLPMFFRKDKKILENQNIQFLENVVNYLLNCIIQKNLNINEDYSQALSYDASSTIIRLMNFQKEPEQDQEKEKEKNIFSLKDYVSLNLEKNFGILIQLISNIDIYIYFLLLDQIISNIKINQRNLIFECLNLLTKKFLLLYIGQNNEKQLYFSQFFTIINSLLTGENKISPENKEEISKFNEYFDPIVNYIKNPNKFIYYEQLISNVEQCIKSFDGINERAILVLKNIKLILKKDSCISLSCYNFVSTFLAYIQKNKCEKPFNEQEIFNEILEIIKLGFTFQDETLKTSLNYALLLTLQILNINPNLNQEVFKYLIIQSFDVFEILSEKDSIFTFSESINQLSLANISLGFIFKPEQTFQILSTKIKVSINGEEKEVLRIEKYVKMINDILKIAPSYYYPSLGKCIVLGICSIFSNNKICQEFLNKVMDFKIFLLISFIKLVLFHKSQKCFILENLMKKELKCNFVEEEENEDEEEEESEDDDEFGSYIDQALNCNDNIKSSDEFAFFSKVMKNIKENDTISYTYISEKTKNGIKAIEELSKMRNIKIKYNEKEYTVPRKTVKIIRKQK